LEKITLKAKTSNVMITRREIITFEDHPMDPPPAKAGACIEGGFGSICRFALSSIHPLA
jgi:hypothetical protein